MIAQQLHSPAPILALQHGVDTDEDLMAQQVVDLVEATPLSSGKCLVWAKSDRVVAAVKALAPSMPVGFVVMNETEQASAVCLFGKCFVLPVAVGGRCIAFVVGVGVKALALHTLVGFVEIDETD